MRIVASACLVLAILFMVGCQQLTDKQKADLDKVSSIEAKANKTATDFDKAIGDPAAGLAKKVADIEAFLKDKGSKFGGYGAPPPEVKPPEVKKPGDKTPPKAEKKEEPKKEPEKKKEPGKTK